VGNSESRTQRILRVSSRLPRLGQAIQQEENRGKAEKLPARPALCLASDRLLFTL
jgi:hypothetical protein